MQILPAGGTFASNLGANIGRGLSEQVPKEVERYRLSKGLQDLEQAKGLTPFQQFTRAAAIPGMTNQMLQSLPEILRTQAVRDYYTNKTQPNRQGMREGNEQFLPENREFQRPQRQQESDISKNETFPKKTGVSPEFIAPVISPEEYEAKVGEIQSENPYLLPEQSTAMADRFFNMKNQNVATERQNQEYLNEKYNESLGFFQSDLGLKLHLPKDEQGQYLSQDAQGKPIVEGELVKSMQNGMANDIATGALTPRQAADKWTTNYLDLVKQNDKLSEIKSKQISDLEKLKGLKTLQKDYDNKDATEYFNNKLRSEYGFSNSTSSMIAYPRSESVKKYIHPIKPDHSLKLGVKLGGKVGGQGSRKIASDIGKLITPKDSLVAIAASIREHDPSFSENQFFDQISEDTKIALTPRQRREASERGSQILPNWADFWYFTGIQENPFYD